MTDFVTTGDVSNPSGSLVMTIGANAVSNAKAGQMPAATFKGNNTGATANAQDLTSTQVKAALAIANTDVTGLGTLSTQSGTFSGTHAGTSSGNNTGDQTVTLTGDVTGSGVGTFGATIALLAVTTGKIASNAVDNTRLAPRPALTLMGNNTGASANPADLSPAQVKALLAVTSTDVSGLGTLATQSGTFAGTHSGASSGTNTGDQTITLTGDASGSGVGSFAVTIAPAAVQAVAMIATDNAQAGLAYTLASGDQYKEISLTNATSCAVSIPLNATYAFPIGMRLAVWSDGAGTYSIVGVSGVTLNGISTGTRTGVLTVNASGVRNGVVLRKVAADTWTVSGAIGAVA